MQFIIGKYLGLSVRTVQPKPGDTWSAFDERSVTLLMERPNNPPYTEEVRLGGRDFDLTTLPAEGEYLALECSVEVRAKGDRAYKTIKGWRRSVEVEDALLSRKA